VSLPYFPMFPADFDADTGHLSLAEDGAYNRLLRLQWRAPGCKLPSDMEWIFRKAKAVTEEDQRIIETIIAEFFTRKGGKIFSARLLKEYIKSDVAHSKRVAAGSKGGSAKSRKTKETSPSNATALPKQPEPEPEPEPEVSNGGGGSAREAENSAETSDDLIWAILHALGFDRGQTIPKYWMGADAPLIVSRWVHDLGLTPDEVCHVARQNAIQHGAPANGPKILTSHMQDYAAAKTAPPLAPIAGAPARASPAKRQPTASEILARIAAEDAAAEAEKRKAALQ